MFAVCTSKYVAGVGDATAEEEQNYVSTHRLGTGRAEGYSCPPCGVNDGHRPL